MPIYLDHHTHLKPSSLALEKLALFSARFYMPQDSFRKESEQMVHMAANSLTSIYGSLGASETDLFSFMPSSKDAARALLFSIYADFVRETGRNHLVVPAMQSNTSMKEMEKLGCMIKQLPLNAYSQITPEILEEAIRPRTALVSMSWANALTGVIHPIYDIARLCEEKGVRLHVDASCVIGKTFFRFQDVPIDYLTFDGAAVHAPFGGGILQKAKAVLPSLQIDSYSVAHLAAFAIALEETTGQFEHFAMESARFKLLFENELLKSIPDSEVIFATKERLSNVTAIAFPKVHAESLLYLLHRKGVYASIGGGSEPKLADLLIHCGMKAELANSALSFCFSKDITEREVYEAVAIIADTVKTLRSYSEHL